MLSLGWNSWRSAHRWPRWHDKTPFFLKFPLPFCSQEERLGLSRGFLRKSDVSTNLSRSSNATLSDNSQGVAKASSNHAVAPTFTSGNLQTFTGAKTLHSTEEKQVYGHCLLSGHQTSKCVICWHLGNASVRVIWQTNARSSQLREQNYLVGKRLGHGWKHNILT